MKYLNNFTIEKIDAQKIATPKEGASSSQQNNNAGNIKVVCRVRPPNKNEIAQFEQGSQRQCIEFFQDEKTIKLNISEQEKNQFTFDRIFGSEISQQQIYEYSAKPVVQSVLEGYNGTVFAYGQTSSGKTHTMQGPSITDQDQKGIIPRMVTTVFQHVNTSPNHIEFRIKLSIVEIYLEKIKDLLDPTKVNLTVREDRTRGVYIQDVTEKYVSSEKEVFGIIEQGNQNRSVAFTNMNEGSSRSHMLFIMTVYQNNLQDLSAKSGKLFLVDLAGSEKISKTGAEGKTLDEAKRINQSLSCLGNVINALTDGKSSHIPYRDSKLTRVLQESLGGNSTTTLIITCSPSSYNDQETLSTLRFGMRAKSIKNKPKVNREYTVQELQLLIQNQEKIIEDQKKTIRNLEKQIENGSAMNISQVQSNSDTQYTQQDVSIDNIESEEFLNQSDRVMELEALLEAEKVKCSSYAFQLNQAKNELTNVTNQMEAYDKENEMMANKLTNLAFMLNDLETEMINNKFNMEKSQNSKQSMMQQISSFRKIHESYKNQFQGTLNNNFNKNQRIIELVGDDINQINKDLLLICQTKLSEEEFKLFLNQMIVQKNPNQDEDLVTKADYDKVQNELESEKQLRLTIQEDLNTAQKEKEQLLKMQEQLQNDLQQKNPTEDIEKINKDLIEIQLNQERQQFTKAKEKILEDLKEKVNNVFILEKELDNQKQIAQKYQTELEKKESTLQYKIDYLEKSLERMTTLYENLISKVMLDKRSDNQEQQLKKKEKTIQKLENKLNQSQIKMSKIKNKMTRLQSYNEEDQQIPQQSQFSNNNILGDLGDDFQTENKIHDDENDTEKSELHRTVNTSDFSDDEIDSSSDNDLDNEIIGQINGNKQQTNIKDQKKQSSNHHIPTLRNQSHFYNLHKRSKSNSTNNSPAKNHSRKQMSQNNFQLDFTNLHKQQSMFQDELNNNLNNSFSAHYSVKRKHSEYSNKSQFGQNKFKTQQSTKSKLNNSQSLNSSIDYSRSKKPAMTFEKIQNQFDFHIQEVDDDNVSEAYNNMNNPQNFAFGNKNYHNNHQSHNQQHQQIQQSKTNYNQQFLQQQQQMLQQQQQLRQLPVKVNGLNTQGLNLTNLNNPPYSTQQSSRAATTQNTRRRWDEGGQISDDNDYYNILKTTETEGTTVNSDFLKQPNPITPSHLIAAQSGFTHNKNLPFFEAMINSHQQNMMTAINQRNLNSNNTNGNSNNNFNTSQVNTTETSDSTKNNNNKNKTGADILRGSLSISPFINTFSFKLLNLQTNCLYAY